MEGLACMDVEYVIRDVAEAINNFIQMSKL